ncbi:MAG: response regulator transcription factor [Chitinophagaceae bacterium]
MSSKLLKHSFESYLNEIYYNKELADESLAIEKLQYFERFSRLDNGFFPLFYVIDYSRQQYLIHTGTDNLIPGYHARDFLEGGLDMLRHVFNKDDFKIYNEEIFSRNCEFLKTVSIQTHESYFFSYNFRVKTPGQRYEHILQRGSYITSPKTGLPLYSLGICLNITALKSDTRMSHIIERRVDNGSEAFQTVASNHFFPNEEDRLFTQKEIQVLCHMADGLGTKQIAGKMQIAEVTVITHKKNMMIKTNTKNGVELVAYCIRKKII